MDNFQQLNIHVQTYKTAKYTFWMVPKTQVATVMMEMQYAFSFAEDAPEGAFHSKLSSSCLCHETKEIYIPIKTML